MKINELPQNIQSILLSSYGVDISLGLEEKYSLTSLNQMEKFTDLLTSGFLKQIKLSDLVSAVKSEFKFDENKAKKFVIEFLGKRFLMVDEEWFKGEVARTIKFLGGDPALFAEDNKKYLAQVEEEKRKEKKEKKELEEERKETEAYLKKLEQGDEEIISGEKISKEELLEIFQVKDPVEERKDFISLFSDRLISLATSKNIALKIYLNNHLIQLLQEDQSFHQELLNVIANSEELLTKEELKIGEETKEPIVKNWLQDFQVNIEKDEEGRVSSLKKARYLAENPNVKKLDKEDKDQLEKLFTLYTNLRNFYSDLQRLTLEDLFLFPVSDQEKTELQEMIKASQAAEASKTSETSDSDEDIFKLYLGRPEEQALIKNEIIKITKKTRLEYDQLAESFEEDLLKRDRVGVIASLKILSDTGLLDNIVLEDGRFKDYLISYFKRNNLDKHLKHYQENDKDPEFVKHFLRYVLQERLGMMENEAARIGSQLSNIFRKQGLNDLSQLAYFDLKDKKFKWK